MEARLHWILLAVILVVVSLHSEIATAKRARAHQERINNNDPGWSESKTIMKPGGARKNSDCVSRSSTGNRLSRPEIRKHFPEKSGIYELELQKNGKHIPVYVGSSSQVADRLYEYSTSGSHKKSEIDQALKDGYSLNARSKNSPSKTKAVEEENKLLDKFDYAWNIKQNGKLRNPY